MPISIPIKKHTIIIITTMLLLVLGLTIITNANTGKQVVNLEDVHVGDFYIHYQNQVVLKDIDVFYENVKKFSQNILDECWGLSYNEKDACINKKRQNAQNYDLVVTSCFDELQLLNLEEIGKEIDNLDPSEYKLYTVAGKVVDLVNRRDAVRVRAPPIIKIRQPVSGEYINVTFQSAIFTGANRVLNSEGKFIELTGRILAVDLEKNQITMSLGKELMTPEERTKYLKFENFNYQTPLFADAAMQIANCAYSKNSSCKCEITFPQGNYNISFEKDNFYESGTETKHYVPTTLDVYVSAADSLPSFGDLWRQHINPPTGPELYVLQNEHVEAHKEEYMILVNMTINETNYKINFLKMGDTLEILKQDYFPNREHCEIDIKSHLFCIEYEDKNNIYTEQNRPRMNFALKI